LCRSIESKYIIMSSIINFFGYTVIPFVVVLGIMIFVHEFGHYIAARIVGVRVLQFKLGFGRYILSFTKGHTEYGVGWIPIGGYVKMFGDPTEIEGGEEEYTPEEIPEEDKAEALFFRPFHQKIFVLVLGPIMNIVLAFLISPLIYLVGVEQPVEPKGPQVVGSVMVGSPAEAAGIKMWDKVVSVDGDKINTFRDLQLKEALNPEKTLNYEIDRDGEILKIEITLREAKPEPIGESGIGRPPLPSMVGGITPGSPAEKGYLKVGDTISSVGGVAVRAWSELSKEVNKSEGKEVAVVVLRKGETIDLKIAPEFNKDMGRYLLGINPFFEMEMKDYTIGEAISLGFKDTLGYVTLTYKILWKLISGQLSGKTMAGPLGIAAITSDAAKSGLAPLLSLMVLISVNLGILNLAPFPPLDGGHILIYTIEGITRREIKMKYKEALFKLGFALLIIAMLAVTVNDVFRYKGRVGNFFSEIVSGDDAEKAPEPEKETP
jgi:regulator of sigma E protease